MRLARLLVLITVLLSCLVPATAWAQAEDTRPPTEQELGTALTEAGDDPAATEPANDRIKALRAARDAIQRAKQSREQTGKYRTQAENAPASLEQLRAEIEEFKQPVAVHAPAGATLAELQREAAGAEASLTEAKAALDNWQLEDPRRNARMTAIPNEIATLQTEIDGLRRELKAPVSGDADPETAKTQQAQWAKLAAELDAAKAKVEELQAEASSYDGRRTLLQTRVAHAKARVSQAEKTLAEWQKIVADRRAKEAKEAAELASQRDLAAAEEVEALAPIRKQILALLDDLRGDKPVTKLLKQAEDDVTAAKKAKAERETEDLQLRERIGNGGGAVAYGPQLQSALRDLKDLGAYRRRLDQTRRQTAEAAYRNDELRELERQSTEADDEQLDALLEAMGDDAEEHRDLATRLLEQRRALVPQVLDNYDDYLSTLQDLQQQYKQYIELSEQLESFVEEHVFWVRSVPRDAIVPTPGQFKYDARWLTDANAWRRATLAASSAVVPTVPPPGVQKQDRPRWHHLVFPAGVGSVMLLAFLLRVRLAAVSRKPRPTTGRFHHMSMSGCVLKLGLAIAAALPMPLAVWLISAWLSVGADTLVTTARTVTPAPLALAGGLSRCAFVWLGLALLRELSRPGAVGASHFRWADSGLAHLRRHLLWFTPIALLSAVVIETFNQRTNDTSHEVVGRLTLAVVLVVVAVLQAKLFSPHRPLIGEYFKRNKGSVLHKLLWVWYPLLIVTPFCLSIATLAGYVYTALQVQRHLGNTFLFILLVIVGQALVLRSLQLARRRIAIEAARAKLAAQQKEDGAEAKPKEADIAAELDLNAINQQSRKVIRAVTVVVLVLGLYAVWNGVLPALRWFERLQVLPTIEYLEPEGARYSVAPDEGSPGQGTPGSGPESQTPPDTADNGAGANTQLPMMGGQSMAATDTDDGDTLAENITSVTVADVGLAVLLLMLTVSASRNVPGLLEITLLTRLPINAAARYALYTVARYTVIIIGLVAISRTLEIPWKNAQWLAAAFTFGLAFGLQEIFANFVSGLIILFEQPIRVGDTVTVGSSDGTVSRIRMRATTVIDWDNKELVIPNKTFITDQITNWTLSDPVTRIIIPVGIAYGADTEKAREILLKIAKETAHTIAKPEPRALFLGFGDNSLSFEMRVHIEHMDYYLAVKSELHFRIDKAFREAGIEISFPQRDLHLRSIDERLLAGLKKGGEPVKEEG